MTMNRDTPLNVVVLCATLLLAVAAGGCAQKKTASVPTAASVPPISSAVPVESGAAHGVFPSAAEEGAAGGLETHTVEAAISALPGMKLPSGPLAASPGYALFSDGGPGVGVAVVAVYYASGVAIVAHPAPDDLVALEAECGKGAPFVDGNRHYEMLSTPLGQVLAIQGGWQRGAPEVTPSRAIFNIDGIGYTIDSTTADPIPVEQLVALAQTMR